MKRNNQPALLTSVIAVSLILVACGSDNGATLIDQNDTDLTGDEITEDNLTDNDTTGTETETETETGTGTETETETETGTETGTDNESNGGSSEFNPNLQTFTIALDSGSTVPPANVDGASGEGTFAVDTQTGLISGSIIVSGTTGQPTAAQINAGASGTVGPDLINLAGNDDGTVWTTPENATLDADGIALFEAGELYINVITAGNPSGELRSQLTDAMLPSPNSITVTLTNTSEFQPMTPPVVVLHNAPDAEAGIRIFEVGQPAIEQVVLIAEDGVIEPLVELAEVQLEAGSVSAAAVGFTDPANPGPLLPGESATVDLELELPDQVMTIISMVVCTNDAFTGVDSHILSDEPTETFTAPIYDAGSETNVTTLNYWVPLCSPDGFSANIGDEENGAIMLHPGQTGTENPDFDFEPGSEFLEVTIVRNQ